MGSKTSGEGHGSSGVPLIKARLNVRRWSNLSAGGGALVAPAVLSGVNRALDAYVQSIKQMTVPGWSTDERLVMGPRTNEPWLINERVTSGARILDSVYNRFRSGLSAELLMGGTSRSSEMSRLYDEWDGLEKEWPSILSEAKHRLGAGFSVNDFPSTGRIWESFVAWCQFSDHDESDTAALLGRFSTFHVPDPNRPISLELHEAFDFGEKVKQLQSERGAGLISEEELLKRVKEINDEAVRSSKDFFRRKETALNWLDQAIARCLNTGISREEIMEQVKTS